MADDKTTAKLREDNELLLHQLKSGVSWLKTLMNHTERESRLQMQGKKQRSRKILASQKNLPLQSKMKHNRSPEIRRQDNKTLHRSNLQQSDRHKKADTKRKLAVTSTPMAYKPRIDSEGNLRKPPGKKTKSPGPKHPKSILVTPDCRRIKTPKQDKPRVTFPPCTSMLDTTSDNNAKPSFREKSFLGYDWIAGALDNDSTVTDLSDAFFEDLKEFRRINQEECLSKSISFKGAQQTTPSSENHELTKKDKENKADICCGSTYTINDRLFPIPIHGPYSQCPVCKTKQEPEAEYEKSYVRVSVPRSSLQSPYRVKPHRRKSFDPSDSVALSEHCLAGWQCARPAYAPGPDTVDLKSNVGIENKAASLVRGPALDTQETRTAQHRQTDELLDTTIRMRYGLQLLEHQDYFNRKPNSTSYPAF